MKKTSYAMSSKAVYFITADDDFIAADRARAIFDGLSAGVADDMSKEIVEGSAGRADEAISACSDTIAAAATLSLFGGSKAVWLRGVNFLSDAAQWKSEGVKSALEKLSDFLSKLEPETASVVISAYPVDRRKPFYKKMQEFAECEDFKSKDPISGCVDVLMRKSRAEMEAGIPTGWATSDSLTMEIAEFASRYLDNNHGIKRLGSLQANIYRGKVGNKGLSGLLFLSPRKEPCRSMAPELVAMLSPGMRNAKADEAEVTGGDCLFLNADLLPSQAVEALVDSYINSTPRQSRQRRDHKSRTTILDILHEEARNASRANSVLLPRDLRRYGRVYRCAHEMFVSTNFFVIEGLDSMDSRLMASWMTTVFFQLSCELFGKNQEGTRKMERGELFRTHIPNMDKIGSNAKETIAAAWPPPGFIDLQKPEVQTTDELWAKTLFGKHWNKMLAEASDLLLRKATLRNK